MTLIVEPVHIVWLVGLALTLLGALAAIGRWLVGQFERRIDQRFEVLAEDTKGWRNVERDLLLLRAELPQHYVRREDYIRNQSVIEAKLDALAAKLEKP